MRSAERGFSVDSACVSAFGVAAFGRRPPFENPGVVCGAPRPPTLVSTGQPDISPPFRRRVIVGISTSPAGTAVRTPQCSDHFLPFHPANLCRPSGTCIDFTTNPALKCRAIVGLSRWDERGRTGHIRKRDERSGVSAERRKPRREFQMAAGSTLQPHSEFRVGNGLFSGIQFGMDDERQWCLNAYTA